MKNKRLLPFKILTYIALGLCAIAVVAYVIMSKMDIEVNYTYRYVGGEIVASSWFDTFENITYIYAGVVVAIMIAAIVFVFDAYKKKQEKLWLNLIVSIILIPVMLAVVIGGRMMVTGYTPKYEVNYYLLSPKEYPVIICEKYREGECLGEVYQITESGEAYRLGAFTTDNGYKNSEYYYFEEIENGIIVYFAYSEKLRGYIDGEWIR